MATWELGGLALQVACVEAVGPGGPSARPGLLESSTPRTRAPAQGGEGCGVRFSRKWVLGAATL